VLLCQGTPIGNGAAGPRQGHRSGSWSTGVAAGALRRRTLFICSTFRWLEKPSGSAAVAPDSHSSCSHRMW